MEAKSAGAQGVELHNPVRPGGSQPGPYLLRGWTSPSLLVTLYSVFFSVPRPWPLLLFYPFQALMPATTTPRAAAIAHQLSSNSGATDPDKPCSYSVIIFRIHRHIW